MGSNQSTFCIRTFSNSHAIACEMTNQAVGPPWQGGRDLVSATAHSAQAHRPAKKLKKVCKVGFPSKNKEPFCPTSVARTPLAKHKAANQIWTIFGYRSHNGGTVTALQAKASLFGKDSLY